MGKNMKDVIQCEKKIDDIQLSLKKIPNLEKIIFVTRGPVYMYDIGYGIVDSGGKLLNYHFKNFFQNEISYDQKEIFLEVVKNNFRQYNLNKKLDVYYLLEDPELGFSPKKCGERPFRLFTSECELTYNDYMIRAGEYRNSVKKIAKNYSNIAILDPKNLYCDDSYCYAEKNDKMLYADDNHHSVAGSEIQAKYFMEEMFK